MDLRKLTPGIFGWWVSNFGLKCPSGGGAIGPRISIVPTFQGLSSDREKEVNMIDFCGSDDRYTSLLSKNRRQMGTLGDLSFMDQQDARVNLQTYVKLLQGCIDIKALAVGKLIHAHIIQSGLEQNAFLRNNLVNMYGKCGGLAVARELFDRLHKRNIVTWNVMISGYALQENFEEGLKLLLQMQKEGLKPNRNTFITALNACVKPAAVSVGKLVHDQIVDYGMESDVLLGTALVKMYSQCANVEDARRVFNKMPRRDVVLWTIMVSAYAHNGNSEEALKLFWQMPRNDVKPNRATFIVVLNACTSPATLPEGKLVHAHIIDSGMESDVIIQTALINMYSICGNFDSARQVFYVIPKRDVVSWNAMISLCARHGRGSEALRFFQQMQWAGMQPDQFTFGSILSVCASLGSLSQGKQVHARVIKSGLESDLFVGSSLVGMYAKCGSISDAHAVFKKMHIKNVVSWNAMISGCAQHGRCSEALELYQQMQLEGLKPDYITFTSVLSACASIAALAQGKQVHTHIINSGIESDVYVGSALVDMYAKCGSIEAAHYIFERMSARNLVSWNSMITGCAQHGYVKEALETFQQMQQEGMKPNELTYSSLLSACSHGGLIDEGCHYFDSMSQDFGIMPTLEHYTHMVDLFARAGCLNEAKDFIHKMPCQPNVAVWMSLLGACRNYGNVEMAEGAAESIFKLEPENDAVYVLLANIYAASSRWMDQAKVRKMMEERCDWTEGRSQEYCTVISCTA